MTPTLPTASASSGSWSEEEVERNAERIAELERALEGAVFVTDAEARRLEVHFGFGPATGRLVYALYKARCPLRVEEIDALLPVSKQVANRCEEGFRQLGTIKVLIVKVRQILGKDAIGSGYGSGYWLTPTGRELIEKALRA